MNTKQKVLISSFSFFIGLSILSISLIKTSAVKALSQAEIESSRKQFYIGQELKPDHVLYPVKVAKEKASLFMLSPEERVEKKIEYASQRMDFAKELLEKGEYQLAVATMIKSQQYLFEAAEYLQSANFSHSSCSHLMDSLEEDRQMIENMEDAFPENFSLQIEQLQENQKAVIAKLETLL